MKPSFGTNADPSQLKVLNLDRMFRKKGGNLTNVVPMPQSKMKSVTARTNVLKVVKKKDKIHDVIEEYNRLIRIMTLSQTYPRLGVKGKNCTATLQNLTKVGVTEKSLTYLTNGLFPVLFSQLGKMFLSI